MLTNSRIDAEIRAAATRLASRLSALFTAEMRRLQQAAELSTTPRSVKASPAPATSIDETAIEAPTSPKRVPLSQRRNVFRVPTGFPLPPRPAEQTQPSGIGQEQVAQAALNIIEQAGTQLTPDQLRAKLNASLAPAIDRLVATGSCRGNA